MRLTTTKRKNIKWSSDSRADCGKKESLPVLSCVLIDAGKGLSPRATNLEAGIEVNIPCDVEGEVNVPGTNISTAEDPAEINLPGVNQVNVNEKAGLTFAAALRAFLRQDPDVIMVGEIRDLETADISIKAAQTGHMVLSTLHTNDAPTTLTRLMNMGVAPFNIASSVILITAQRWRAVCAAAARSRSIFRARRYCAQGSPKMIWTAAGNPMAISAATPAKAPATRVESVFIK